MLRIGGGGECYVETSFSSSKCLLNIHYFVIKREKKKKRNETNSWCLMTLSAPIKKHQLVTLICVQPCRGYT